MLFIVSREDVNVFGPAFSFDPQYAQGLLRAQGAGVEILVYQCQVGPEEVKVVRSLPLKIDQSD